MIYDTLNCQYVLIANKYMYAFPFQTKKLEE